MLGVRPAQRGLLEADHLYLDYVPYGFLASLRGLFRDEEFAEDSVPPSLGPRCCCKPTIK